MKIIVPNKLKHGDKVVLLTPGGKAEKTKIESMKKALESLGLNVVISEQNYLDNGYFAGTDQQRVDAIHSAFADKSVKGIFCVRGGHGSIKLLNKLDYDLIRSNPKIFTGMSDISILQSAILNKAGLETYNAPVAKHFEEQEKDFALRNLRDILFDDCAEINLGIDDVLIPGNAEGVLIGGNLAAMAATPVNKYWYTDKKSILLIEELNEYGFRMDRCLGSLVASGVLDNVQAVVVGQNSYMKVEPFSIKFNDMLLNYFKDKNIPIVIGAKFGHKDHHLTLPIGRYVKLELTNNAARFIL